MSRISEIVLELGKLCGLPLTFFAYSVSITKHPPATRSSTELMPRKLVVVLSSSCHRTTTISSTTTVMETLSCKTDHFTHSLRQRAVVVKVPRAVGRRYASPFTGQVQLVRGRESPTRREVLQRSP